MAIDEVVGTTILSRADWLYPLLDPLHRKGKGEKQHPPESQDDETPLLRCILIEEGKAPAQSHHPIFRQDSPPVAPPAQYQSLIIMLPVGAPDLFSTQEPSSQCHGRIHDKRREDQSGKPQCPYS